MSESVRLVGYKKNPSINPHALVKSDLFPLCLVVCFSSFGEASGERMKSETSSFSYNAIKTRFWRFQRSREPAATMHVQIYMFF